MGPLGQPSLKIVCMGDSTTAGTPGFKSPLEAPPRGKGDERSQYAYWMMRAHSEWNVLNRGVNGQRSDQILDRFPRDVVAEKPRFVVILAGVNDIYQGLPLEFTEGNLERMYEAASNSGATPVACTILPYNLMTEREGRIMNSLNGWIASKCRDSSIALGDTSKAVADLSSAFRLMSSPDGLHPDVAGYRKMAEVITNVIEHILS